ncbi:16S rRNA (uracil(1498)-N(3))-methyltransferase [Galactobacter valiniphilus]|uniref:16S rRNA (uracil(1498)-N(3))-methyltransferase n=1 Tax=Galactobacter valiniphilus TaxID=2676122 RepID=UPI00373647BB
MSRQAFLDPAAAAGVALGESFELSAAEAHHAKVKRVRQGEQIDVVDGAGRRLVCEVLEAEAGVLLRVLAEELDDAAARPRFVLVQALSKQDRDLQAVESCVEIGIDAVIPWQADRSIVRWKDDRAAKAHAKWEHQVAAAVKQSRRSTLPPVEALVSSKSLAARAAEVTAAGGLVLVLHEAATVPLLEALGTPGDPERPGAGTEVLFVVGPEGGISDAELAALEAAGARTVVLGTHVLRASTAGSVALVLLLQAYGAFGAPATTPRPPATD